MNKRLRFGLSAVCASKGKKEAANAMSRPSHVVENGERNRPGRRSRRPADCCWRAFVTPNRSPCSRQNVFGQRPKTAGETPGETPALPEVIASLRLSGGFI